MQRISAKGKIGKSLVLGNHPCLIASPGFIRQRAADGSKCVLARASPAVCGPIKGDKL